MGPAAANDGSIAAEPTYRMRLVTHLGRTVPILVTNTNHSPPLTAICNSLLLKNLIELKLLKTEVALSELILLLGRLLTSIHEQDKDTVDVDKHLPNLEVAIEMLPLLADRIDVNYETTKDVQMLQSLFKLLGIQIYWIVYQEDIDKSIENSPSLAIEKCEDEILVSKKIGEEEQLMRPIELCNVEYDKRSCESYEMLLSGIQIHVLDNLDNSSRSSSFAFSSMEDQSCALSASEEDFSSDLSQQLKLAELESEIDLLATKSAESMNEGDIEIGGKIPLIGNSSGYAYLPMKDLLDEGEICLVCERGEFSTMIKFKGDCFLLVTQGYLNQPGLVWQKSTMFNDELSILVTNEGHKWVIASENLWANDSTCAFFTGDFAEYFKNLEDVNIELVGGASGPVISHSQDAMNSSLSRKQKKKVKNEDPRRLHRGLRLR